MNLSELEEKEVYCFKNITGMGFYFIKELRDDIIHYIYLPIRKNLQFYDNTYSFEEMHGSNLTYGHCRVATVQDKRDGIIKIFEERT
jgi:hypothetical protein